MTTPITPPSSDYIPSNPEYFVLIPAHNWDPQQYIEFSAKKRQAGKYGLKYLDRGETDLIKERHSINVYRWQQSLRSYVGRGAGEGCERARSLLEDETRYRLVFRKWFAKNFGPYKPTCLGGPRGRRGPTINNLSATINGPVSTLNQGLTQAGNGIRASSEPAPSTPCDRLITPNTESGSSSTGGRYFPHDLCSDDGYSTDSRGSTPEHTLVPELTLEQEMFATSYSKITEKWMLSTGRVVEDIIHSHCMAAGSEFVPQTSLLPSFVIDLGDENVRKLFYEEEWEEMCSGVPDLPKADESQCHYLAKFAAVKSERDLIDIINLNHDVPIGETYSPALHYTSHYSKKALYAMHTLYSSVNEPLKSPIPHTEIWYVGNVWAPIIDQCMHSVPGITLERSENHLQATATRRNLFRTKTGRGNHRKGGRHHDGIIYANRTTRVEYVVFEASRSAEGGETSTKYLNDWLKVGRALRDMLNCLHEQAQYHPGHISDLQAMGITTAAGSFQFSRMVNPKGNVCLLKREKYLSVPTSLDAGLGDLVHILIFIIKLRTMILNTRSSISKAVERTGEQFLEELRTGFKPTPGRRLTWAVIMD